MMYLILFIILVTIYVKFEPRLDKVNGEWGVWYTINRSNRKRREFKFLRKFYE